MSEYASAIDRVRRAFASIAKLEGALMRDPDNVALQVNLAASMKLARKSEAQLRALSELQRVDICNYRLVSDRERGWKLSHISKSLADYQSLFTQVHDAVKNGPKRIARYGQEVEHESAMELGYTYSGSLGFVLLAYSDRDFFSGKLDRSIDVLMEITTPRTIAGIQEIAHAYGNAVVKRLFDWSKSNVEGHFSTDLLWQRSDGRLLGHVVDYENLLNLVNTIASSGDEKISVLQVRGRLVGGDIDSGSFHFVVSQGADYRGSISESLSQDTEMVLGKEYLATIRERSILTYALEREEKFYILENLA